MQDEQILEEVHDKEEMQNEEQKTEEKPALDEAMIKELLQSDAVKKFFQSESDKIRGKYSNELKKREQELSKKDAELKKLRTEYLSREEIAKLEYEEKLRELEAKSQELEAEKRAHELEKRRSFAKDLLARADISDDKEKQLKLVNMVVGADDEETERNVQYLSDVVAAAVNKTFKASGRHVTKTTGDAGFVDNPWAKDSWNLTKQMELEVENPELAEKLKMLVKNN